MTPNTPFDWTRDALADLASRGLLRGRRTVVPMAAGQCRLLAATGELGPLLWNFSTNDYLGLADHPSLRAAATTAIQECGTGARASALVTGRTVFHDRLERRLAEFKGMEAALLFPSGYAANVGAIAALVEAHDLVLCDRLNHASLVEGCRLSRAKLRVYPHCDLNVVERELIKGSGQRRKLIVTDSLFSMDGDAAPLGALIALAEQYGAMLLVDEAHATGVCGKRGTGLLEDERKSPNVVAVGTLSKALGSQGGFVTGSQAVIDWMWNSARPQMFSTALTPAACAAAAAALEYICAPSNRHLDLADQARTLRDDLIAAGWTLPAGVCGPIIPLLVGDANLAVEYSRRLQEQGCLVSAIRPPTVPNNTSRLRISISYAHGDAGLFALKSALATLR